MGPVVSWAMGCRRERKAGDRGAAMVEFAFILLPLTILLFGIVEFALIMYDKAVITNASREGARLATLYYIDPADPANLSARRPDSQIQAAVREYAANHLITFGTGSLQLSDIQVEGPLLDANSEKVRRVTVNYRYDFMILPSFITSLTGPVNLSATTVMRDENQTEPAG